MKPATVSQLSVQRLVRMAEQGHFGVPKLQREFVWTGAKAAKLLDSLHRSMPVGTLVVWRTSARQEALLRRSADVLPAFDRRHRDIRFLIDGQQRLSVLYRIVHGGKIRNATGAEVDFERLTFNVAPDTDDDSAFQYRLPVPGHHVSLRDLLDPRWSYRLRGIAKRKLDRAAECRERLLRYKMPVLEVESDELDEVRELFVRINTQGMRIRSADAAFARATRFDLRERARELRQHLPTAFRRIPDESILQALAFVEGIEDVGDRAYAAAVSAWDRRNGDAAGGGRDGEVSRRWTRFSRAFELATEYLATECHVVDETILPSSNMLATLTVYFFRRASRPRGQARKEIRSWFWATAVGQRYSGRGYRENLIADRRFFDRLAESGRSRFSFAPTATRLDLRRAEYGRRTSLTDAFFCLLAAQAPRFVVSGDAMPSHAYASRGHQENRHHIFPKARLASLGYQARDYNTIANICLLPAQENQAFGSRLPREYLIAVRGTRHFRRAMASHLVPPKAIEAMWQDDTREAFREFRLVRERAIADAFEAVAGVRLFRDE